MEEAKNYLERYTKATSREERKIVLADYQQFLGSLPIDQRNEIRQFMKPYFESKLAERVNTLDALTEKANLILSQKGKITYEGKEYILGEWVTIADYCRLYNFKPSRVQNWIDREIVPRQNVIVIQELNNLKLVKNVPYRM
ncbi:hypothetical protein [Spirosoma aerolatum]|uniref:hypothetical protein n=1 Tax=Spirosoma aerolatum TaxID=1211326 RepID=UPI0009AE2FE7|nr:hypothetical protein [Spirosoma aerolatum]